MVHTAQLPVVGRSRVENFAAETYVARGLRRSKAMPPSIFQRRPEAENKYNNCLGKLKKKSRDGNGEF
jgi:hypothetical protein